MFFKSPKKLLFFFRYPLALFGLSAYPFNDLGEVFPKPVWAKGFTYRPCSNDILQEKQKKKKVMAFLLEW